MTPSANAFSRSTLEPTVRARFSLARHVCPRCRSTRVEFDNALRSVRLACRACGLSTDRAATLPEVAEEWLDYHQIASES